MMNIHDNLIICSFNNISECVKSFQLYFGTSWVHPPAENYPFPQSKGWHSIKAIDKVEKVAVGSKLLRGI